MPKPYAQEVAARFPKTVLEDAQNQLANPSLSLIDRFTLLGVTKVVQGGLRVSFG